MRSNAPASKPCSAARLFEIEDFELHLGKGRQLLHCPGEERRRHVAERVGVQAALEQRQHVRRQSTRASPNLQDAQSAALGQMTGSFLDRGGNRRQPVAGEKPVTVELIQQIRSCSREQDLNRLLFAAQDGSEFRAVCRAEQTLGEMAGMLRDE